MHRLTKALVVVAVAAATAVGGPLAADAATAYPPGTPAVTGAAAGTVTGSISPGGTFTVHFNAVFIPRHDLAVYFVSAGSVPTALADFRAAESPALSTTTGPLGDATVSATLPADASAPVTVEATDGTTTAAITIPVTAPAAAVSVETAAGAGTLSQTGTYISIATVWGAVGVAALGVAFLLMRSFTRRGRIGAHRAERRA
jgi:hypothetical protein